MENNQLIKAYGKAVARLVDLAKHDTSGSRAAAQVLLSTYNGYNWHLDATDLCLLDEAYLEDALTVLRCRATLHAEPHKVIPNGKSRFIGLCDMWENLHVNKRYGGAA